MKRRQLLKGALVTTGALSVSKASIAMASGIDTQGVPVYDLSTIESPTAAKIRNFMNIRKDGVYVVPNDMHLILDGNLFLRDNQCLQIDGSLTSNNSHALLIQVGKSKSNVEISGSGSLIGTHAASGSGVGSLIKIGDGSSVVIKDITILDSNGSGIEGFDIVGLSCSNINIRNCRLDGISIGSGSQNVKIQNCTSSENMRNGVAIRIAEKVQIDGLECNKNTSDGLSVIHSSQLVFNRIDTHENNQSGIALGGASREGAQATNDWVLTNIRSSNNSHLGIAIDPKEENSSTIFPQGGVLTDVVSWDNGIHGINVNHASDIAGNNITSFSNGNREAYDRNKKYDENTGADRKLYKFGSGVTLASSRDTTWENLTCIDNKFTGIAVFGNPSDSGQDENIHTIKCNYRYESNQNTSNQNNSSNTALIINEVNCDMDTDS